jgi:hypothetical protein
MAKCVICKEKFKPKYNSLQKTCDIPCAIVYATEQNVKNAEKRRKKERQETRKAKIALRTKPQWIKFTQPIFNKFIRFRDYDEPCISCGRYDWEIIEKLTGGKWDCGHYKTVGAFPELRFEERNAHKQCKSCNGGSGKYTRKNHTVSQDYTENLIVRIGQEDVDWLNGPHDPKNYIIEEIQQIRKKYAKMALELEKAIANR